VAPSHRPRFLRGGSSLELISDIAETWESRCDLSDAIGPSLISINRLGCQALFSTGCSRFLSNIEYVDPHITQNLIRAAYPAGS
jgi:hypothetical protein